MKGPTSCPVTAVTVVANVAGVFLLPPSQLDGEAHVEQESGVGLNGLGAAGETPYLQFLGTKAGTEYWEYAPAEPESICGYSMLYAPPNTVIDFAQDARDKLRHWGVAEKDIDNILFTHSHYDHFDAPTVLSFARDRWRKFDRTTHAFASEMAFADLQQASDAAGTGAFLTVTKVTPGDQIALAENVATIVLPSSHHTAPTPIHFLLEFHGKEILYSVDAAALRDDYFAHLQGHHLDVVITDCTYLDGEVDPEESGHMNYSMVCQQMAELSERGFAANSTRCYITHLAAVDYRQCAPAARKLGLLMAYDGLRIFFP